MGNLLRNDWLKIAVLVFALGAFSARSESTAFAVARQEPRIKAIEEAVAEHRAAMREIAAANERSAATLSKAVEAIDRVNADLQGHKLADAADTARLQQALAEIDRLRDHR